ncbi:MAG: acyl-CoA dehydrogenase family protein [Chloroflexota bacterium]|nr:acyl-CoA dehydrogenase family protein [Chloroflexota bacterium]
MDFSLNEEQEMLRSSARDFLAEQCPKSLVRNMAKDKKGFPVELWKQMAGLGWIGLVFPEVYGGSEGSFLDLTVLLEEMGRACLPGPFFSTVILGGLTILDSGNEEQKRDLLSKIARGETIVTLALLEPGVIYDPPNIAVKARSNGDSYTINGPKLFVNDAHIADNIICAARTGDRVTLFIVDAKNAGVETTLLETIAGDKQCEVAFRDVEVTGNNVLGDLGKGWGIVEETLKKAKLANCADMVGISQQVLEMTIDYAKKRVQFERPIGSFQVIQHYCADMAIDVDTSRFITYKSAWMMSSNISCDKEVNIAKAWVNEACKRVVNQAIHIFASIGMTEDHDMPLYFKRAKRDELLFGSTDYCHEIIAKVAETSLV